MSKVPGYLVHLFTTSGVVCSFFAVLAADKGEFQIAFGWMFLAMVIDTLDGSMARRINIREMIPKIDGHYLDLVVDYVSFVFLPAIVLYKMGALPEPFNFLAVTLILVSGSYNFALANDTSDDGYFVGFPAAWHVLVMYFYLFESSPTVVGSIVGVAFVLHFVPLKFVYITKNIPYPVVTLPMILIWMGVSVWSLVVGPPLPSWLAGCMLVCPAYFLGLGFWAGIAQ